MLDLLYPRLPWNAGDTLLAAWREDGGPRVLPVWKLDEREGVLLPSGPDARWAVAWRPTRPVWATPHGVCEPSEHAAGAPPAFVAVCPGPDVLWGESDLEHRPTLEGETPPKWEMEGIQLLETEDLAVRLFSRVERGRVRFAVVICRDQADNGASAWARFANRDPAASLADAHAPYLQFARRQASLDADDFRRIETVVARMIRELRTSRDGSRLFRIGLDDPARRARSAEIDALVRAWCEVRPDVACALLRTLLAAQTPDGALPAYLDENGFPSEEILTRPCVARSFRLTWNRRPEREWFDAIAPRVRSYLDWLIHLLDPTREGLPRPAVREDAIDPDLYEPDLLPVDLPALLAREISDLEDVAGAVPLRGIDLGDLPAYRDALLKKLQDFWWSEETRSFSDRYQDGRPSVRVTVSALMPLLCRELDPNKTARVLEMLVNRDLLLGPTGFRAWVEGPTDTAPAPVRPVHQLLLLDALAERNASAEYAVLRGALLTAIPAGHGAGEQALVVALLAVPAENRFSARILSPALLWLNQRRRYVLAGLAILFLLVNVGVILYWTRKTTLTPQAIETTVGLARRYYREGHFEEAERLLGVVLRSGNPHVSAHIDMGNVYYRLGRLADAEAQYRKQEGPPIIRAQAQHNLAVTLLDQGRTNEARAVWETVLAEYSVAAPAAAERAKTALSLLPSSGENHEGAARQGGRGEMPQ
jgi:tetratricopeptide (TPR) repeat protein